MNMANKTPQTFDEFLHDRFIGGYSGIQDDCEDAFDYWLSHLDVQELIDYAEDYGEQQYKQAKLELIDELNPLVNSLSVHLEAEHRTLTGNDK